MKYTDNILEIANLQPDYLGFIFYARSKRFFDGKIPSKLKNIKKVGVFVNESIEIILDKINQYNLNTLQLHGDESPEFCKSLQNEILRKSQREDSTNKSTKIEIIKVFSVGEAFDFTQLQVYQEVCDFFLFDTKGKERGGNGTIFNWELLKAYPFKKPYFLSGGIGLEELNDLNKFLISKASKYCYAIDVNSKMEDKPGLKNIEKLRLFSQKLEN